MLARAKKSATFADLADAVWNYDHELSFPWSPMSQRQAKGELQNALKVLRIMKRGLREAMASGNPTRISAWNRSRNSATVAAFVARERFHRPDTYLRAHV